MPRDLPPLRLSRSIGTLVQKPVLDAARRLVENGGVVRTTFFREAIGGDVGERDFPTRRAFALLKENGALRHAFCTCRGTPQSRDLCRHLVALFLAGGRPIDDGRILIGNWRFEAGLFGLAARGLFEEERSRGRGEERVTESRGERLFEQVDPEGEPSVRFPLPRGASPAEEEVAAAWRRLGLEEAPHPELAREAIESILRKETATEEENRFARAGFTTPKQAFEKSFWYALGVALARLFGDWPEEAWIEEEGGRFRLELLGSGEAPRLELRLPSSLVDSLLRLEEGRALLSRSRFDLREGALAESFRLEVADDGSLVFDPVLALPSAENTFLDRVSLEPRRVGRFFLLPGTRILASPAPSLPMFADPSAGGQLSFGFSGEWNRSPTGLSREVRTVVPPAEVFGFVERFRDELATLPPLLAPEFVRRAEPLRLDGGISLRVEPAEEGSADLLVEVLYDAPDGAISFLEIQAARREKRPFLVRKRRWFRIDDDERFGWMGRLGRRTLDPPDDALRLRPLEILRLLAELPPGVRFEGDAAERIRSLVGLVADGPAPEGAVAPLALFDYQKTGLAWLWFLWRNRFGGLLCDDMGLGKTHQAMALVAAARAAAPGPLRVLVACPASLVDHWLDKLAQHLPGVSARAHLGAGRALSERDEIVVSSYGTLRNDADLFADWTADLFVLDEIQTIKNRSTSTYQALERIPRRFAVGLTGTPVENEAGELRNLLDFVLPGYLPGETEFARRFSEPIEAGDPEARDRLARLTGPFLLRRTKGQVLRDLPDKILDRRLCSMTPEQEGIYRDVLARRGKPLLDRIRGESQIPFIHVFALLNKLKQICDHTALVAELPADRLDPSVGGSGKWELFLEILEESLASGLKVVVFSQYVRMLALVEKELLGREVPFATIKGETRNRGEQVARFQSDPECRVFTASLRAGGLGIDLTAASVVIHYDRWWNQAREDQATDRLHRLGQTRGVQVVHLLTRGTIEEKIDAIIARKDRLARGLVREDDPSLAKQFSREELEELLGE
jgi:superfamily II DNA or RNA helicase